MPSPFLSFFFKKENYCENSNFSDMFQNLSSKHRWKSKLKKKKKKLKLFLCNSLSTWTADPEGRNQPPIFYVFTHSSVCILCLPLLPKFRISLVVSYKRLKCILHWLYMPISHSQNFFAYQKQNNGCTKILISTQESEKKQ